MEQILIKTFEELRGHRLIRRGLEREALRITSRGRLSERPHPHELGASLTHKYITTDYSEALVELVTPPFETVEELSRWNLEIHKFCAQGIGDELLWPLSMPCILGNESEIPIAEYGPSNVGQMKKLYRVGLSHRYGSAMQVIAGIHYNFSMSDQFWQRYFENSGEAISLQDFKSKKYMALVRNFLRIGWIVPYLFGASPVACKTFYNDDIGGHPFLKQKDDKFIYGEYATSLRMSDLGYRNYEQDSLDITYNDLGQYVTGLVSAIRTPSPRWKEMGVKVGGKYQQLNDSILQIENEYYGMIRPKRATFSAESPSCALLERGIQYVEIRSIDINPYDPCGLSDKQIRFLDLLLLHCLMGPEDLIEKNEDRAIKENFNHTVLRGRDSEFKLNINGIGSSIQEEGAKICSQLKKISGFLDEEEYGVALEEIILNFKRPDTTLSARLFDDFQKDCFCGVGMYLAREHKKKFKAPLSLREELMTEVQRSHQLKSEIEEADRKSQQGFDHYLEKYFFSAAQCLKNGATPVT